MSHVHAWEGGNVGTWERVRGRPRRAPVASAPRGRRGTRSTWPRLAIPALVVALCVNVVHAEEPQQVELLKTDSRSPYVHRLTLYDEDGKAIDPAAPQPAPYSPKATCGKCHPVTQIAHGWHFNAWDPNVPAGRPGEPWILTDPRTGTVLPISGRRWSGTFTPEQVGLSDWQFVLRFGGHTPGGGYGDQDEETIAKSREAARWRISGPLEVDCMFCHSADQQHDPAEAEKQIDAQNFRWAPTVALGLGVVRGEARKAPDDWDPSLPPNPDYPEQSGPKLIYDRQRFDPDNRVLFSITRRPAPDRCYFCHSFREVGPEAPDDMVVSRDVHLAAGLLCVDCHRNEVDHDITRGYDGEAAARNEPWRAAFTCEGCHLGTERKYLEEDEEERPADTETEAEDPLVSFGGRYGAPRPEHRGLPPVHLEKLTCTACHSGPWPNARTHPLQTALAHGLGWATRDRTAGTPPGIVAPVFVREGSGKIAPHRLILPAFWGRIDGDEVVALPLQTLQRAAKAIPRQVQEGSTLVQEMLTALAADPSIQGEVIYASALRSATATIEPHTWPLAHDVRPAAQSLGVKDCTDCHVAGAPLFSGQVNLNALEREGFAGWPMWTFYGYNPELAALWDFGFVFRPAFKWFGFICAGLIALVLLRFALDSVVGRAYAPASAVHIVAAGGVPAPPRGLTRWEHLFHTIAGLGLVILAVTGFGPKLVGAEVAGWMLLAHMLAAPLFIIGLTGAALQWVARCRFGGRGGPFAPGLNVAQKQMFWLTLLLGFASLMTMLLAMLPAFGPVEQRTLIEVHSYSSLLLLIVMVPHTIISLVTRRARGKAR